MAVRPLPSGFGIRLDPSTRRPAPNVLVGGSPTTIMRLTDAGAALVDRWAAGAEVGPGRNAGALAARLVEAGMASPSPPPGPPPGASVVIPVRDDPAGLAATLAALAATAPGVAVTVVDDGSSPPVAADPAGGGPAVGVHRRAAPGGPAAARNTGWSGLDAGPEVVVFVDAGCVPEAGWLERVLAHFADPGTVAVAPRVRSRSGAARTGLLNSYESARSPLDLGPKGAPVRPGGAVAYVPSAVMAVRVDALAAAGGFDETMRFGEDVDLVWRLVAAGGRVRFEPSAVATHPARPDGRAWLRQRFDYGRSATPLAARHGRAVAPLAVSPWTVAAWALAAGGRPGPALAVVAGTAEVLARRSAGRAGPAVAAELRRRAWAGQLGAGAPLASVVRRAWLPPALVAGAVVWRCGSRRARRSLAASAAVALAGPGAADWWRHGRAAGGAGPARWVAWRLADDLAYQAGVWAGAVQGRSAGALLPRWARRPGRG